MTLWKEASAQGKRWERLTVEEVIGPIVLPNVFRAYDAVLYPTIMIAVVARKRPKNTSNHRESLDPTASICGDAVPPDPSAEPATPREHLYARSLVWTEPGGPRHRCLRAVAWVPGVAGVGPPSLPPVQPQRGVEGLTGLDFNELPKRKDHPPPFWLKVSVCQLSH